MAGQRRETEKMPMAVVLSGYALRANPTCALYVFQLSILFLICFLAITSSLQ